MTNRAKEIIKDNLEENNLDFGEEQSSKTEQEWEKNQERMEEEIKMILQEKLLINRVFLKNSMWMISLFQNDIIEYNSI